MDMTEGVGDMETGRPVKLLSNESKELLKGLIYLLAIILIITSFVYFVYCELNPERVVTNNDEIFRIEYK